MDIAIIGEALLRQAIQMTIQPPDSPARPPPPASGAVMPLPTAAPIASVEEAVVSAAEVIPRPSGSPPQWLLALVLRRDGSRLEARSDRPVEPGTRMRLSPLPNGNVRVESLGQPASTPVNPGLQSALREVLPKQLPLDTLVQALRGEVAQNALPAAIRPAVEAVLARIPSPEAVTNPQVLRSALENSGTLFETRVARALGISPGDGGNPNGPIAQQGSAGPVSVTPIPATRGAVATSYPPIPSGQRGPLSGIDGQVPASINPVRLEGLSTAAAALPAGNRSSGTSPGNPLAEATLAARSGASPGSGVDPVASASRDAARRPNPATSGPMTADPRVPTVDSRPTVGAATAQPSQSQEPSPVSAQSISGITRAVTRDLPTAASVNPRPGSESNASGGNIAYTSNAPPPPAEPETGLSSTPRPTTDSASVPGRSVDSTPMPGRSVDRSSGGNVPATDPKISPQEGQTRPETAPQGQRPDVATRASSGATIRTDAGVNAPDPQVGGVSNRPGAVSTVVTPGTAAAARVGDGQPSAPNAPSGAAQQNAAQPRLSQPMLDARSPGPHTGIHFQLPLIAPTAGTNPVSPPAEPEAGLSSTPRPTTDSASVPGRSVDSTPMPGRSVDRSPGGNVPATDPKISPQEGQTRTGTAPQGQRPDVATRVSTGATIRTDAGVNAPDPQVGGVSNRPGAVSTVVTPDTAAAARVGDGQPSAPNAPSGTAQQTAAQPRQVQLMAEGPIPGPRSESHVQLPATPPSAGTSVLPPGPPGNHGLPAGELSAIARPPSGIPASGSVLEPRASSTVEGLHPPALPFKSTGIVQSGVSPQSNITLPVGEKVARTSNSGAAAIPAGQTPEKTTAAHRLPSESAQTPNPSRPGGAGPGSEPEFDRTSQALAQLGSSDLKPMLVRLAASLSGWLAARPSVPGSTDIRSPLPADEVNLYNARGKTANPMLAAFLTPGAQFADPGNIAGNGAEADAVEQLLRYVEGALARTRVHQFGALQETRDTGDGTRVPTWITEVPLAHARGVDLLQLRIERRDASTRNHPGTARLWQVLMSIQTESAGPMHALVRLSGQRLSATLWAERAETLQAARSALSDLEAALRDHGVEVERLECKPGRPADSIGAKFEQLLDVRI